MSRQQKVMSIVGASVAIVVLGHFLTPDSAVSLAGAQVTEPVASTQVVCPETRVRTGLEYAAVAAVVAPIQSASPSPSPADTTRGSVSPSPSPSPSSSSSAPGAAGLAALPNTNTTPMPLATITESGGSAAVGSVRGRLPAVLGAAAGSLAPGFSVAQWTYHWVGSTRGVAGLVCTAPSTDQWFVGGGSGIGRLTTVVLINAEDGPAQVDVDVYGPMGQVVAPAGQGVLIRPHGRVALRLTSIAPGLSVAAVHVQAQSGRVMAALYDRESRGLISKGYEWVPTTTPSRHVVIPGGDGGAAQSLLSVLAPGGIDADVAVTLITSDGRFIPAGHERVDAVSGRVVTADLTAAIDGQHFAIQLDSDRPIVAGLHQYLASRQASTDSTNSTGVPALTGPSVAVGLTNDANFHHTMLLSAPAGVAKVGIQVVSFDGTSRKMQVFTLAAGKTSAVPIARTSTRGTFSVVLTPQPGSGPVYAASYSWAPSDRGPFGTVVPLTSLRTTVTIPDARPDLGVAFATR